MIWHGVVGASVKRRLVPYALLLPIPFFVWLCVALPRAVNIGVSISVCTWLVMMFWCAEPQRDWEHVCVICACVPRGSRGVGRASWLSVPTAGSASVLYVLTTLRVAVLCFHGNEFDAAGAAHHRHRRVSARACLGGGGFYAMYEVRYC